MSLIRDQSKENVLKLRPRTIVLMQTGSLVYLIGFLDETASYITMKQE